ncbi:hypothetical protein B9Z19DRAFT_1126486 [Tuber borchii]|uniref:Uncharacterized protein n=1 Tax=Tuber borchii TaxID=42251 RepID=A0A2T6ZT19_TUBBO|nr:hypothetical protein B9Z19DRAFT_1126486 [Tuber borchii]
MSVEIFEQVRNTLKAGKPDMLHFDNVDPEDFAHALESLRHPSSHLEERSFRIHWFSSENRLKVVMPSMLHECVG